MTGTSLDRAAAAAESVGWVPEQVEPLQGSDRLQPVVGVRRSTDSAVLKRYAPAVFDHARLVGGALLE